MPFAIGDVVQLKSGGPLLTVTDISMMLPDSLAASFDEKAVFVGQVTCCWFSARNELQEAEFIVDVLKAGS